MSQDLTDYRALLEKVSAKFEEVSHRHQEKMKCGRGCSQCCAPDLTVFAVERENIASFLNEHPDTVAELERLERENPHGNQRCRLLRVDGSCSIYEVRPVICRSHGAPVYTKSELGGAVDVCPLNFSEPGDLKNLKNEDIVNLDLLNQILVIIDQRFGQRFEGAEGTDSAGIPVGISAGKRYSLKLSDLLGTKEEL